MKITEKDVVRFMAKVQKPEASDGCWMWTSYKNRRGYGMFSLGGRSGRPVLAHRFAYFHLVGPVGEGLHLDHLCRNPACVNPAHLEPVTARENCRRSPIHNGSKTHCPKGHEYTPENVVRCPSRPTHRLCRKCIESRKRVSVAEQLRREGRALEVVQ